MNNKELKEEFARRVTTALDYIKNEEVKAIATLPLVYKLQSLADLISEYDKKPTDKKEFVKEVDKLIYSMVSTFSTESFKAGAIINFQSYLVGLNTVVKNYVNKK